MLVVIDYKPYVGMMQELFADDARAELSLHQGSLKLLQQI